jgi:hypothetical protein
MNVASPTQYPPAPFGAPPPFDPDLLDESLEELVVVMAAADRATSSVPHRSRNANLENALLLALTVIVALAMVKGASIGLGAVFATVANAL